MDQNQRREYLFQKDLDMSKQKEKNYRRCPTKAKTRYDIKIIETYQDKY